MEEEKNDNKDISLKEAVLQLTDTLKDPDKKELLKKKKKKTFKFPWMSRVSNSKAKKNYITIMKINENGSVNFTRDQIEDQSIMLDDVPRLTATEDILYYKGKPMIIQPAWSVKPFSAADHFGKTLKDGSNSVGYRLLLAKMKAGVLQTKKKLGMGAIGIGVFVIGGIIAYAVFGGS